MDLLTFVNRQSNSLNLSEIIILPSSSNDIKPPSNNLSWFGHNKSPLSISNFSLAVLTDQGFIWLAVSNSLFSKLHKQQVLNFFNSLSLKTLWLILTLTNAFLSSPFNVELLISVSIPSINSILNYLPSFLFLLTE